MLNISIDLGSYSVKFLCYKADKKSIQYTKSHEVIIDQDEYNIFDENALQDLQLKIVSRFLEEQSEDFTIILSSPNDFLTTRILNLPVNNKKKANLMLPFQLETDLPYSLSAAHFAHTLQTGKKDSRAIVNIAKRDDFQPFFEKLKLNKIQAKILTSEVSSYDAYMDNSKEVYPEAYCIFDIGHTTSKAYFFINNILVSTHIGHIAGSSIDEAIAQNYNISREESSIYKHQNAFMLNENQYDKVTDNQRAFAKLMDETLTKLVNDFKRWEVGFRVKYAKNISHVYLTGGTSNIRNIDGYLQEKLGHTITFFDSFSSLKHNSLDKDEKFKNKFSNVNVLSQNISKKAKMINLLSREFALGSESRLPVHSFYYIGIRAAILSLILIVSFSIERFLIHKDMDAAQKKISKILKNPNISLTPRERRNVKKKPKSVLSKLSRQEKVITQEVKVIQSSIDTNALRTLKRVKDLTLGLKTKIINFQSVSQADFIVVFEVSKQSDIEELNSVFRNNDSLSVEIEENLKDKTYKISGSDL